MEKWLVPNLRQVKYSVPRQMEEKARGEGRRQEGKKASKRGVLFCRGECHLQCRREGVGSENGPFAAPV